MRFYTVLLGIATAQAFQPVVYSPRDTTTVMEATRRDTLALIGATLCFPAAAGAFSQQLPDNAYEPQQQRTDGKLDLNSAFVVCI